MARYGIRKQTQYIYILSDLFVKYFSSRQSFKPTGCRRLCILYDFDVILIDKYIANPATLNGTLKHVYSYQCWIYWIGRDGPTECLIAVRYLKIASGWTLNTCRVTNEILLVLQFYSSNTTSR